MREADDMQERKRAMKRKTGEEEASGGGEWREHDQGHTNSNLLVNSLSDELLGFIEGGIKQHQAALSSLSKEHIRFNHQPLMLQPMIVIK